MATPNTKINPAAKRRLGRLKAHVQREFGLSATHEDIVSALVLDTSTSHLAGTLMGYEKWKAASLPQAPPLKTGESGELP